jgi:hypothetical protein
MSKRIEPISNFNRETKMGAVLTLAEQRDAEELMLRLAARPEVRAAKAEVRRDLGSLPIAASAEGAARLDRALDLWANSLALRYAAGDPDRPRLLWAIDPTPRRWFDHNYPGAAWAGENPDFIYRIGFVDGRSRYEIIGCRQAEASVQFNFCSKEQTPGHVFTEAKPGAGDIPQFDMLQDSAIRIDANGEFRISVDADPADGRRNHLRIPPASGLVLVRDCLSDWGQSANALHIRRLSGPTPGPAPSEDAMAAGVAADLAFWASYWARFAVGFMNHPEPNTLVGPYPRDDGWGYAASGGYRLDDDEALVITVDPVDALYQGMMIIDPWMITPESANGFASRNNTQTTSDENGNRTFVISARDPGFANWIDTGGMAAGWMMVRIQKVEPGRVPTIERIEVRKLAGLDLPGVARAGPDRATERAARAVSFARRHA